MKEFDKKEFNKFEHEVNLVHEVVKTPPVLFMVGGMVLTDSVLITVDLKSNTFFQIFKLPAFDYIGGFIKKGKGPNEEITVSPYMQHIENNKFLYQSNSSIKIAKFNIEKNRIEIINRINLPGKLINLNHAFSIRDNYYGWDLKRNSKKEFVGYNPKTKNAFDFGHTFPKVEKEISFPMKNMVFAKAIAIKPDKSHFACVYDKFPILRIYKNDGTLLNETRYVNNQNFPQSLLEKNPSRKDIENIMQNYRKIKATERFIYALYIGKTEGEIDNQENRLNDFSNEIHVWDWMGNPIKKILLDKNIFSFCVAPNDTYLICSSINKLDFLYKYSLNKNENQE
jgi:hypothetical protein